MTKSIYSVPESYVIYTKNQETFTKLEQIQQNLCFSASCYGIRCEICIFSIHFESVKQPFKKWLRENYKDIPIEYEYEQ